MSTACRPVVMVSENLARELWGSPSAAIGKRIRESPSMPWQEVIGVVAGRPRERRPGESARHRLLAVHDATILSDPDRLDAMRTVTFAIRSERAGTEAF